MDFIKKELTKAQTSKIKSILNKIHKNNIDIQGLEAVSNKRGNIIFSLYKEYRGREPYNLYILYIKKEIYLIIADMLDAKKEDNIIFLSARFFDKDIYHEFYQAKTNNIEKIIDIANDGLLALSDGRMKFDFDLKWVKFLDS